MPQSIEAVVVIVVALLPGALYTWSFERLVGRWGIGLADRVLRFVGVSSVFHAVLLPLSDSLWRRTIRHELLEGSSVPWIAWIAAMVYVAIPVAVGSLVGAGVLRQYRWAPFLTGRDPAPRAWDHLFSRRPQGWVRMRMKSGTWLGGAFSVHQGVRSYVAGYPEQADIYCARAVEVDPDTGDFILDGRNDIVVRESSLLVRWDEMEYLEFIYE